MECNLFGIFVDRSYRQKGISKELILLSIYDSYDQEVSKFYVPITEPSEEKDALYKFILNLKEDTKNYFYFEIIYDGMFR